LIALPLNGYPARREETLESDGVPFKAVANQRLYERVAEQIGGLIERGEFKPGDRLPPERDLARKLAVSRPVVREAMIALELAGLVEVRTGAGTYVRSQTRALVRLVDPGPSPFELLAARRLVESEVAALAAMTATENDIAALRKLNEAIKLETQAGRTGVEPDRSFHRRLAETTGNAVLTEIVWQLWEGMTGPILNRFHELTNRPGKHRTNIADHEAIIVSVERRDAETARRAMAAHIGHVEAVFVEDEAEPATAEVG
jgi:DNA-binding FadR family transcriptional regulator